MGGVAGHAASAAGEASIAAGDPASPASPTSNPSQASWIAPSALGVGDLPRDEASEPPQPRANKRSTVGGLRKAVAWVQSNAAPSCRGGPAGDRTEK
jgi:hypothetical protein